MLWPGAIIPHMAVQALAANFPVVETTATTVDNAGSANTANLPTGIVSGNLLLLFANGITGTASTPSGWTALFTGGGNNRVYYRVADGLEGSTVTIYSATPTRHAAIALRISTYQGTPEQANVSATFDSPSLSPSWGEDKTLWVTVGVGSDISGPLGTVDAAPTNYSGLLSAINDALSAAVVGLAYRQLQAASEDPGAFSVTDLGSVNSLTVAVRGV